MRKTLITTVAALATLPLGTSAVLAEDLPISANISIVTDYAFRGYSQTDQRPALQGGLDYEHDSGFYIGLWGSNISWLSDAGADSSSLEINVYAGYTTEIGPLGLDVGLLQYYYPGKFGSSTDYEGRNPNTLEGYVGLSWEFLSFKYSHAFSNLFGFDDSKNSQYYQVGANYEIMEGLTLDAHYGYSSVRGRDNDSWADWKLGVTKSWRGFDFGLHYVDTDVRNDTLADDRYILSVSKAF